METSPATPVTELTADRCLRLRTTQLGRIAVVLRGELEIFPVNYAIDHGAPVFRTAPGGKLRAIDDRSPVAFEVDGRLGALRGIEPDVAWSVVIKGRAKRLRGVDVLDTVDLDLWPEQIGAKPVFVRIEPDTITGRTFPVADHDYWATGQRAAHRTSPE